MYYIIYLENNVFAFRESEKEDLKGANVIGSTKSKSEAKSLCEFCNNYKR